MDKTKAMLVEDHVLVRERTRELLGRETDVQVVAEVGDGEKAVPLAAEPRPDVVLWTSACPGSTISKPPGRSKPLLQPPLCRC